MRILATLDGSKESLAVLPALTLLATEAKAEITLLTVAAPPQGTSRGGGPSQIVAGGGGGPVAMPLMRAEAIIPATETKWAESKDQAVDRVETEAKEALQDFARPLLDAGLKVTEQVVMAEDAAGAIIDFAKEKHVDLIAMATHGRTGLREVLQGSVAAAVLKSGVAPMLLVRPKR